jgi:hypothetical protein
MEISESLQWKDHNLHLTKKLNQTLFLLRRVRELVPKQDLITVAEALFNSKLRYGIAAYGKVRYTEQDPKNGDMAKLQVIQNEMMRLILGFRRSDKVSVRQMLQTTGFHSVNQLIAQHSLVELFNVIHLDTNPMLRQRFIKEDAKKRYDTRSNAMAVLDVPIMKKEKLVGFPTQSAHLWNMLPCKIRMTTEKNTFKANVKKWINQLPI